jgi:GGDEF domain-containing protein
MFGMASIVGLANINTQYGNDAGDTVITDVAKACTDSFKEADVYRTGSSEFVIVQRCNRNGNEIEQFLNKLNELNLKLNNNPHRIPGGGMIMYPCRTIAASKSDNINTSVITVMKSAILNNGNPTGYSSQLINLDA